jgi:hypothetical protein
MNQFGLIIQETTAGSNQQFVSAHLDINSLEIKETITDERTLASQLANLSDVYSVQVTKNYKVYSLIVTNLTDFLGRSGYYAIRLYGPKGINLTNFESILANVKEKYNNYTKSNTLNNQNYEDILSSISIVENDRKNFVAIKSTMNCFYYFDDANSTLSTVFNTKGVNLVHKIYAFNKNKAVNESVALTTGLKSFSQINASQKEINVVNLYGVLNELKINDQLIDFNSNVTEFNVLCQTTDRVVYNAKDDKTYKTITKNFIDIEEKFVPRHQYTYSSSNQHKKKKNANVMYLIMGLMALVIGGGIFILTQGNPKDDSPTGRDTSPITEVDDSADTNVNEIEFIERTNPSNKNKEYTTNYPKLKKYVFSYGGNKKWSFSNTEGQNIMGDFYKKTLDDFDLTSDEKESLIEKLEKISGHEISDGEAISRVDLNDATKDKATKDKATKDKAAKDKATKDKAAKDKATKDKAAKDKAAKDREELIDQ